MLLVGKVIRPHGWGGLLRVWSYAGSQNSFLDQGTVFLKSISGKLEERTVLSAKLHKNFILMELKGLSGKDDAEAYRGTEIFIRKAIVFNYKKVLVIVVDLNNIFKFTFILLSDVNKNT